MTCFRNRGDWHSYVKNSLSSPDMEAMATHLKQCPDCQDLVSAIKETSGILTKHRVILSPPASIKINVMMAIDKNKYKKVTPAHVFELKNWGFSMVAAGLLLLALNLTSLTPNFQSGQVADLNSQIGQQIVQPFAKISQAAYLAKMRLEAITLSPKK